MHDMSNTRKEIAARLGFAAGNGAKVSFERYEIGDAFKFEDKIYVINSHANEINAVLSSADSNAKKALSLADFAHSKWLQFEGKAKSSRPGAKAEFAMKVDMPELRAEFLGFDVDSNGNKIARFKKYSGETVRIQTNGNLPKSHRMTNQSLDAKAIEQEVLSSSYASKFALKPRSSRPGAKAAMAADWKIGDAVHLGMGTVGGVGYNGIITKLDGDTVYIESTETDNKYGPRTFKGLVRYLSRNARPGTKTRMTREQTEEQKAGLKIMSAADAAIGAKIATLIKEGKPQDQAVAIALDMKRRGEL